MDRLFLTALVRELDASLSGSRIRGVRLADDGLALTISLSHARSARELTFHLAPGVAGLSTREESRKPRRSRPREAKLEKFLASSSLASIAVSELDRVATVNVEQIRLSGKKRNLALVLELVAVRKSLYIVDVDTSSIVDCLSTGTARLAVGKSFRALEPPPGAARPAESAAELEERIAAAGATLAHIDRATLMSATGWTPLLVDEMLFRVESGAGSVVSVFDSMRAQLAAGEPVLYVHRDKDATVLLSPLTLSSKSAFEAHAMGSFNDAMVEAVRRTVEATRMTSSRQRIHSAIAKRHKSLSALVSKLGKQRQNLPEPGALRRQGETLLAGMAQIERIDESHVRLPDPFDADARAVEIEVDAKLSIAEFAERLFRRARKVERTEVGLGRRIEELEQRVGYLEDARMNLDDATTLDELDAIRRELEEQTLLSPEKSSARSSDHAKRLPPRRFTTSRGGVILVGRSARSNAELTFHVAKPEDLWLHASGIPGSHVVLKRADSSEPDEDDVLEAAGYAAHFSKGRNESYVDVMVTERRHVSSIKGAPPGLVKVSKATTVRVRPMPPPTSADDASG